MLLMRPGETEAPGILSALFLSSQCLIFICNILAPVSGILQIVAICFKVQYRYLTYQGFCSRLSVQFKVLVSLYWLTF